MFCGATSNPLALNFPPFFITFPMHLFMALLHHWLDNVPDGGEKYCHADITFCEAKNTKTDIQDERFTGTT